MFAAFDVEGAIIWLVTATQTQARKIEKLIRMSFTEIVSSYQVNSLRKGSIINA